MATGLVSTWFIPETKNRTLEDISNEDQENFITGGFHCDMCLGFRILGDIVLIASLGNYRSSTTPAAISRIKQRNLWSGFPHLNPFTPILRTLGVPFYQYVWPCLTLMAEGGPVSLLFLFSKSVLRTPIVRLSFILSFILLTWSSYPLRYVLNWTVNCSCTIFYCSTYVSFEDDCQADSLLV